jgi:hypothetical protein
VVTAHGFFRYVSTPITPPIEFRWWLPIAIFILFLGAFIIIWRLLNRNWLTAIVLSICTIILYSIPYFLFGRLATNASTAPPPGLDFPHPTFWGFGWLQVGSLFVRWNLYGYGFLIVALFLCGGIRKTRGRFMKLSLCAFIFYIIALAPYIATGAFVHGLAGGYVYRACEERLEILNSALIEYGKKHNGQLPTVDSIKPLLKKLNHYMPQYHMSYYTPIDICPIGGAFEREPKHYLWNTNFSGVLLQDIDPEIFYEQKTPIYCPYHEQMPWREAEYIYEKHMHNIKNGNSNNTLQQTATNE